MYTTASVAGKQTKLQGVPMIKYRRHLTDQEKDTRNDVSGIPSPCTEAHMKNHRLSEEDMARSNLDSFMKHTTPSVQCQYPSKTSMTGRDLCDGLCEGMQCMQLGVTMPYFNMRDLWSAFDEWSAYGVGVPLVLPTSEVIVQYYVPYLSALQIYSRPPPACSLHFKQRRSGDDSEGSDAGELTSDFSAEFSSDAESRSHLKPESWETASTVSSGRSSSLDDTASENAHGNLIFEYLEKSLPHCRGSLAAKVNELIKGYPHLYSLKSNELSSASWLSVAWYPIYRIPTGTTMQDYGTCFLTYHSLWTPLSMQDIGGIASPKGFKERVQVEGEACHDSTFDIEDEKGLIESNQVEGRLCSDLGSLDGYCKDGDLNLKGDHDILHHACRVKVSGELELPAFGLVSYKLKPLFWASPASPEGRRTSSLASSADSWLKQLKVQQPDFEFFTRAVAGWRQ